MSQVTVAVRVYMHQIVRDHTDPYTGETNCTAMAEEAAFVFDLLEAENGEIPEWVFDQAFEVSELTKAKEVD